MQPKIMDLAISGLHSQVLIPVMLICTAFLTPLFFKFFKQKARLIVITAVLIAFLFSIPILFSTYQSNNGYLEYFPGHSWSGQRYLASGQPIGIVVKTDILGALVLVLITGIGLLATIYSVKYIAHEIPASKEKYYYTLLLLMIAGMSGIALTGDCFNFYVFLEVASISSYALVAISGRSESLEAAFKYMIIGALSSVFILFGIGLMFTATGTLNMAYAAQQISRIVNATEGSPLFFYRHIIFASLGLFIMGFSIKSAFIPAHAWLADAHPAAPSSVSAILSGLMVKATGVFILIRFLFSVFGIHRLFYSNVVQPLFLVIAVVTILGGSIFAIAQNNLKRMLAYSTVAQLGYMLLGISLFTKAGLTGAILHLINHSIVKSLLFLTAGAVIYKTGIREIPQMKQIGYKMPVTMGCFTVAALSVVGIPPLSGFMSKWVLATAAFEANMGILVVVLLISSLLNASYYFRVVAVAFFSHEPVTNSVLSASGGHNPHSKDRPVIKVDEVPWLMLSPILLLGVLVVFFGLRVDLLLKFIEAATTVLLR